jgi:hypothetical protein
LAVNVTALIFAALFFLVGVGLIVVHRRPGVANALSTFWARGQTPAPYQFGSVRVLVIGVIMVLMGLFGLWVNFFVLA